MKPNLQKITDEGFTDTGMEFGYTSRIYERVNTNDRIIYDDKLDDVFRYQYKLGENDE